MNNTTEILQTIQKIRELSQVLNCDSLELIDSLEGNHLRQEEAGNLRELIIEDTVTYIDNHGNEDSYCKSEME